MKTALWAISFLLFTVHAFAAAPIVHIFLAQEFAKKHPQTSVEAFYRGSVFPDIRYIAHVPRAVTHENNVSIALVLEAKTSFHAGCLFHSYVDDERANIVEQWHIAEHLVKTYHLPQRHLDTFIKYVEDALLTEKLKDPLDTHFLTSFGKEELKPFLTKPLLKKWYALLLHYCSQPLEASFMERNSYFIGLPETTLSQWEEALPQIKKDPVFTAYLNAMLHFFRNEFSKK
jgi:hypothetical protein